MLKPQLSEKSIKAETASRMRWVGSSTWILFRERLEGKNTKTPTIDAQFLTQVQHFWNDNTSVLPVFIPSWVQMVSVKDRLTSTKLCHNEQNYWPRGCVQRGGDECFAWEVWGQRLITELSYKRGQAGRQRLVSRRKENTFASKNSMNRRSSCDSASCP